MPDESPVGIVWMKNTENAMAPETAENTEVLRIFSGVRPTGRNGEDCYTFERFAPVPGEIHTYYYCLYKRKRVVLKEETTWS
jgi:hypothetical protein